MPMLVDAEKIKTAARNSIPLTIKSFNLTHETEEYLERVLNIFLSEQGQEEIADRIAYCMKELAVNANKANTKRVYFHLKGLDINSPSDYNKGMEDFKSETLSNIDYYLKMQKDQGYYVKVVFQIKERTFTLSVQNNTKIGRKEQIRVYDRIARARAFTTMEEALSTVLDDSEGAGLGIVILVLMLKKLGLDEDHFDISVAGEETIAKITIPFSKLHLENLTQLSTEIVAEIDSLPQFPDNIVHLQRLINDPDSEMTDIAKQIMIDPALTADLLKLVNSAQFMLPKKVDNIIEAVKMVGLRGIKNLLFEYGTQQILSTDQKWLWDHSYRTAYYAYHLARNMRKRGDVLDDAYIGGILHDIGKIVFAHVHPDLIAKISNFCAHRNIRKNFIEDLSAGLNHAEIGSLIAKKWNFPEPLVEAIRCHHEPQAANPQYKDTVYCVYMANAICNLEDSLISFDQFDKEVLAFFNLTSEENIKTIQTRLRDAFSKENNQKN